MPISTSSSSAASPKLAWPNKPSGMTDWSRFEQMDPHLLVGLVNTALRNEAESLEDLCRTHDIDADTLCARFESVGYVYQPEQVQFR